MVTHKDKEHIHNHLVVNSVSFENGLKYNASNKSLWDIKRESNRLCERENLKTLDLDHKAEKRISSAEKRIMDRGQIPWKDELRQIIDIARERTKDLQSFREFLEKNFEIETRVTKNSISYKHPDHGKAIRGRSLGDKYNKEELENEFNGQEKSIFRNGANERGRAKGNSAFGYEGISDLYEALTGIQYLSFIADIYKISKEQREKLIKYYGDKLELTKYLGDLISSYSHGMKQKLAVISALIHKPKLLILDEPFVGLDPKASHTLKEIMRELCNEGSAIFFSTHVLEVAEKLCDKIAIIKDGKIVAEGTTEQVKGNNSLEEVFMELIDNE